MQRCAPNAALTLAKAVLRNGSPDGSARSGETTKESVANWLAHREPMGKRPPAASIHVALSVTPSNRST
ncbi:hypothetical protein [Sporosarcina sp. P29]|uniref:hypothetical protein n=1 Tax=Sporosarcina sp. P29 TaxID=2048252 RepID=UPI00117B5DDB|nr:hypothetical protein [Sporosarcina sp. P29]